MDKLITHTPAEDVTDEFTALAMTWPVWDSRTHPQAPPKSGKFLFDYNGDYETERVLIKSGSAKLSPTDGSDPITINEGDQVFFHKGFSCNWHVTKPMKKHYAYYDEDGVEVAANPSIACDICEADCYEESYLTKEEEDICPDCYKADKKQYAKAEHQKFGEPIPTQGKKREAPAKNGASKKAKGKKQDSDSEDESDEEKKKKKKKRAAPAKNGASKKAKAKKQASDSEDEEDDEEEEEGASKKAKGKAPASNGASKKAKGKKKDSDSEDESEEEGED